MSDYPRCKGCQMRREVVDPGSGLCNACLYEPAADPTPTPIDPADIRPGDVVERRIVDRVTVIRNEGDVMRGTSPDGGPVGLGTEIPFATWHLVHRPDPDAEAVEALLVASGAIDEKVGRDSAADDVNRAYAHLAALREQGWDVVRRAEEKP